MNSILGRAGLLAATALAGSMLAATAQAQTAIDGEGASAAAPTVQDELAAQNAADTHYVFTDYSTSSGKGQTALLNNAGTATSGVPSGVAVEFALSEGGVNNTFQASWNAAATGLPEAGQFIQFPLLGSGMAIPFVQNTLTARTPPKGDTKGGNLKLTDSDLCGIFSGKVTTWDAIPSAHAQKATGPFHVYYRADSSGSTFLLTQHLAAVCTTANSNVTFTATSTFANLFGGTPPANFVGETGSAGLATAVQNDTSNGGQPSALGYVTPDYTNIAKTPAPGFGTLPVASVVNATNNVAYQPFTTFIAAALAHPGAGATNGHPPAGKAAASNQLNWVPALPIVTAGYPIVGYTAFLASTCYADTNVTAGVVEFLTNHYAGNYTTIINDHGFVPLAVPGYVKAITNDFLTNTSRLNLNFGNTTGCKNHSGRPDHSGT